MVKAPKDTFAFAPLQTQVDHNNPFTQHLPDDTNENLKAEIPALREHCLLVTAPAPVYTLLVEMARHTAKEYAPTGNSTHSFTRMMVPVALSSPIPQIYQGSYEIIIHSEHTGTYYLHSILASHVFHNYDWKQIDHLYSA